MSLVILSLLILDALDLHPTWTTHEFQVGFIVAPSRGVRRLGAEGPQKSEKEGRTAAIRQQKLSVISRRCSFLYDPKVPKPKP